MITWTHTRPVFWDCQAAFQEIRGNDSYRCPVYNKPIYEKYNGDLITVGWDLKMLISGGLTQRYDAVTVVHHSFLEWINWNHFVMLPPHIQGRWCCLAPTTKRRHKVYWNNGKMKPRTFNQTKLSWIRKNKATNITCSLTASCQLLPNPQQPSQPHLTGAWQVSGELNWAQASTANVMRTAPNLIGCHLLQNYLIHLPAS